MGSESTFAVDSMRALAVSALWVFVRSVFSFRYSSTVRKVAAMLGAAMDVPLMPT